MKMFARTFTGTSGQQLLANVNLDDEGNYVVEHRIFVEDLGVFAKMTIGFGDGPDTRERAFAALDKFTDGRDGVDDVIEYLLGLLK